MLLLSLDTGLFFLVLLLNHGWSPLLRVQVSDCSTSDIMCHVPSMAVFCSASIACFPGMASKFFFKHFVTILVAAVITGIIIHFMFHIHCTSVHQLLYFSFYSASFCMTFLFTGIATCMHVFSFLLLIIISGIFIVTSLSVYTAWFHNTNIILCTYTGLGACIQFVCHFIAWSFAYWVMQMCTNFIMSY